MKGDISTKVDGSGNFAVASKNMEVNQPNGTNNIKELYIADNKEDGFKFHIKEDEKQLPEIKTKMSKNYLEPIIGTSKYSEKLFEGFDKAKESINVESFLFNGKFAEDITDKLIMKASGLNDKNSYSLKVEKSGVKVKLIFDSSKGDKTEETHESFQMVKNKVDKFINDVEKGRGKFSSLSKEQRQEVIDNLKENMRWKLLNGGITKIDHRKEVIIDGKFAFSGGGINLTDSALKKHDTMMEVWGPAVNYIQKEFIENWEEVAGKISETEKSNLLKDTKSLESAMKIKQKESGNKKAVNSQILVTDDNRFDTYQKIMEKIKTSKKINIEHAYFTDKKVIDELAKAIKRGAEVNVIVPEYSDEGDLLHYGNLGSLLTLHEASKESDSKGKFNAYLYKWNEKENTGKFSHTKAMSFDGKSAIVGSTNLTSRSLTGTLNNFLFNKEMSILIEDENMISGKNKGIDDTIFKRDMSPEFSKKLDDDFFKNLYKEKDKINKYTQLQPLF
ncbi:MAG: phosphatidylserine/phosphatidylglycerophosphate/cardiolipin synthase family protein [Candidatus Sericytochromatia bacterium]